jgi:hypothetical protein
MKILLAAMMTTVMATTAFGACDIKSPDQCKTKTTCEGLSKEDGQKFTFDEKNSKCMFKDVSMAATDCIQGTDTKFGKSAQGTDAPGAGKPSKDIAK